MQNPLDSEFPRVNAEKHQLEMTFRSGDRATTGTKLQLSDLLEGQKVQGRVKKIEEFGIFIQIDDSKVSGLCHKSEVCDGSTR
jgi:rRNA biogenesis protein RRP5